MTFKFKKLLLISFLIFSIILPFCKINAETDTTISNVGFVKSNIWYSKEPFEEGDKIKIYTLIFNPENKELSGTVMFFDQEVLLGKKDIKVLAKSTKDVSIDWTVTAGKHSIYAKIENAKFLVSAGKYETALLNNNETEKDSVNISKKITENNSSDVNSVMNLIQEKTPAFISKPIIATTDALENFRETNGEKTETKKEEAKTELETIKQTQAEQPVTERSKTEKPMKYLELFVLQIASFIFNNQYVFYTVLFILVFLVLRYIWLKIF
jgi:hypothetical protein